MLNDMPSIVRFDTTISNSSPDAEKITNLTGGVEVTTLHFNYHVELSGKVTMRILVAGKAGETLNLYYFGAA